MPKYWLNVLFMLLMAVAWPLHSKEMAYQLLGVTIPASYSLPSVRYALVLNGFAARELWGAEAYVASLYTNGGFDNANLLLVTDAPAVMKFTFIQDNIAPYQIVNMLETGITLNNPKLKDSPPEVQRLHELVDTIDKEFNTGDTLTFQYYPENQTLIVFRNYRELAQWTRAKRFFNMLLKMWIGEHPPSREFKEKLLENVRSD